MALTKTKLIESIANELDINPIQAKDTLGCSPATTLIIKLTIRLPVLSLII